MKKPIRNIKKRNIKKRNSSRVNDLTPRYYLRPRKFHATEIIDDESETLNGQSEEFRVPSPIRSKYANLPEMDLLSEEEISNSREGTFRYDKICFLTINVEIKISIFYYRFSGTCSMSSL